MNLQSLSLGPNKIYSDDEKKIYFHSSGTCYDPAVGVKAYYKQIDQDGGDLRPLYYVQSGGDFSLAIKGKNWQSNKIVLEDKYWDRKAIYNVKSPVYKSSLMKMFREKLKEGKINFQAL